MEWFKQWFNEEYLALYSYRDKEEARSQVDFVLSQLPVRPGVICDVACGTGRHLEVFVSQGFDGIGVDLSLPLLRRAEMQLNLVMGDMRFLPIKTGTVSLITNFFTSFGYFQSEAEELRALREFYRVLKNDGTLVIDVANATSVVRHLESSSERSFDGARVSITREIIRNDDTERVKKTIKIFRDDNSTSIFTENVRLFTHDDLKRLVEQSGFTVYRSFGEFKMGDYLESSPRIVMFVTKGSPL